MIEAGECEDEESLRVEYSIKYGKEDWTLLGKSAVLAIIYLEWSRGRTWWNISIVDIP